MPVAYIPRTRDLYSDFTPYRWVENPDAPAFTPLPKPLVQCRVALISSGGIMYFGYPTRDAERDPNCVFPLERLRELEARGVIGELADPAFSFMGGIYSARKVRDELAPQIVSDLKRAHADALFLVPA